jgi:hypothetical protein
MVQAGMSTHAVGPHSMQSVPSALRLAFVQPQPMSRSRLVFLVVLVVFFCGLFISSYIWMRRPRFGQGVRAASSAVKSERTEKPGAIATDASLCPQELVGIAQAPSRSLTEF